MKKKLISIVVSTTGDEIELINTIKKQVETMKDVEWEGHHTKNLYYRGGEHQ